MGKRFWIILGVTLIIGLAVFIFLIWQNRAENKKAPSEGLATGIGIQKSNELAGNEPQKEPEKALVGDNLVIEQSKGLEFKPFFEEGGETLKETFLESFFALSNPPIPAPKSASVKKEQSSASAPKATSTEIILSLTDDEFHFLYPDDFIASLMEAQNFIKEYIPNYEPISKIETDFQVRFIEEKMVTAFLSANMLTEEEAERAITTIRFTLPQLQLKELRNQTTSLNEFNTCFLLPPQKGLFFAGLIERLYSALVPQAQAKPCGYCYSWAPCFQVGASNPVVGSNTFATYCYCTGCYWYAGCLSRCTGQSAIWDPLFLPGGTGICGCG